jgi:hypothetical protein
MTRIRLQFVHAFHDRHGKLRHYFRRPGFKQTPLVGPPGSAEFMEAYQAALAGLTTPHQEVGVSRTKPGTVNTAGRLLPIAGVPLAGACHPEKAPRHS